MLDGREMPEEEEELVRAQFGRIDSDGSAEVDWWEFMKFEARRYLARKSEVGLQLMMGARFQVEFSELRRGRGLRLGSSVQIYRPVS